jgi:hypothetical protein
MFTYVTHKYASMYTLDKRENFIVFFYTKQENKLITHVYKYYIKITKIWKNYEKIQI